MIVPGIQFVAGRNDYGDRDGTKYGIAIHNTSNTASAAAEASYATRRTDGISSHFYVDDQQVIQSIDTKYRAGHAGSYEGNEHAVAVEITGTNDRSRSWWMTNVAWDDLGRVLAQVCRAYGIEPRRASVSEMKANPKVRAFYSHDDMRRAWGGTTHTDPGPNFPWDLLFAAVKVHLDQEDDMLDKAHDTPIIQTAVHNTQIGRTGVTFAQVLDALRTLPAQVQGLRNEVAAVTGRDPVDEQAIVAGVLAGLDPQAIAAAIPAELAKDVADELARRMAA